MPSIETILASHGIGNGGSVDIITGTIRPNEHVKEGLFFYNEETKEFSVYLNNSWRSLNSGMSFSTEHENVVIDKLSSIVTIPYLDYLHQADVLFVTINGMTMYENRDYRIVNNGKSIFKISGDWRSGDIIGFTRISVLPSDDLKLSMGVYEDHVVVPSGSQIVYFNIPLFDPRNDMLRVYHRNLPIFKDVNYTLNDDIRSITLLYQTEQEEEFHFEVLRKIRVFEGDLSLLDDLDYKFTQGLNQALNDLATLDTKSTTLDTKITQGLATATTRSTALDTKITQGLATADTRSTALDTKITQGLITVDTKITQGLLDADRDIATIDAKTTQGLLQNSQLDTKITQGLAAADTRSTALDTKITQGLANMNQAIYKENNFTGSKGTALGESSYASIGTHYQISTVENKKIKFNNIPLQTFSTGMQVDVLRNNQPSILAVRVTNVEVDQFSNTSITVDVPNNLVGVSGVVVRSSESLPVTSIGTYTKAVGPHAYAQGNSSSAVGAASHAEGMLTNAIGSYSHAEGLESYAGGQNSHAEGYLTFSKGVASHAEGYRSMANGQASHSEGMDSEAEGLASHAEGDSTTAAALAAHAEGKGTHAAANYSHSGGLNTYASGVASFAHGIANRSENYGSVVFGINSSMTPANPTALVGTSDAFVLGNGASETAKSNAFRVTFDGRVFGRSAFNSTGADYAEYFEWADGNTTAEDRTGIIVTLDGEKIREATSTDSYVLGVISVNPTVIGDSHQDAWVHCYQTDLYGRILYDYQTVEYEEKEWVDDEYVNVTKTRQDYVPIPNPDWDPSIPYIPRSERPEWDAVGMMGKLLIRDDGTCEVNSYGKIGEPGKLTHSTEITNFRVMKRISDDLVFVFIK